MTQTSADDIITMLQTENKALQGHIHELEQTMVRQQQACDELQAQVEQMRNNLSIARAELVQANRTRDDFLANVSHEFRTPLNAILGLTAALQEDTYGLLNEKQRSILYTVEMSGQLLLALISDIIDLAKAEAGKLDLQFDDISIEAVCQASLGFIAQEAQSKNLGVSLTCENILTTVRADHHRLKQILIALLKNAVKFTPDGGQIGLDVAVQPDHDMVAWTVWDTGVGIAAEHLSGLFKPFAQVDSSTTRQHGGVGLGLALVARLVALHGGSVSVESWPGEGSQFTVQIPIREVAEAPPRLPQQTDTTACVSLGASSLLQPVILIVDNDKPLVHMLTTHLASRGYRSVVARTVEEAHELARNHAPSLLLLSLQVYEMVSLNTVRRIRQECMRDDLTIVVLTTLSTPGERERCMDAGANEYVKKPFGIRQLDTILKTYLGS